jgi:uncharacterized protein YndB with AHSA1/START domain
VATLENTVVIRRPTAEVFGFLADLENLPRWNYAIVETHKISQGPVGVGTIYQQVRSVPSRSEERFEVTAYNPPRHLEIRANSGRSPHASPMPWTPFPREPGSPTQSSWSSAGRAGCLGGSPCPGSGRPWPPTSRSSRSC